MDRTYWRRQQRKLPRWLWWVGIGISVLLLANAVMWVAYRGRVLPNVSLGAVSVGNISYGQLDEKVDIDTLLANEITLTKDDRSQVIHPVGTGIMLDWPATRERLKQQRSWFPLANLLTHRSVPIELTVDEQTFAAAQANLVQAFFKDALPERIVFSGQNFEIAAPEAGYRLDESLFKDYVLAGLEAGQQSLVVPTAVIEPPAKESSLDGDLQTLRKKLAVKMKFSLNGKTIQPSAADIGGWFVGSGRSMVFSADKVKAYVAGLGSSLYNTGNAASATSYALEKQVDTTFVLSTTQATKYTYCVATKGVDKSHLPGFIAKAAAVLGDPRGWNKDGKIAFEQVEGGCDFDLWLSAPSHMTSFGGACDSYYSCRAGRNVVINFDRWQGATDPWNASGGSLEDYRVMVTNHEVGHWLGFGHRNCTGPGQPAPVMQQQSIGLQGCSFNPWPTQPELAAL